MGTPWFLCISYHNEVRKQSDAQNGQLLVKIQRNAVNSLRSLLHSAA